MIEPGLRSTQYQRVFFFILFFAAAAASFHGFYSKWHFRETGTSQFIPRISFEAMVDGTADRPFVYRQLVPMLVNWIDAGVSAQTKEAIYAARSSNGIPVLNYVFDSPITGDRAHLFRYTVAYIIVAVFACIAVWAMYLAAKATGQPPVSAALAAVSLILFMPYFLTVGGYLYDYPELAFFAFSVWMSIKFDWWWIIPVAVLGTLNKESFLFFIPALYPFLLVRSSRRNALIGTGVLGLISAFVYGLIRSRFQHNPGATVEIHLMSQIKSILFPTNWFLFDVTYGEIVFRGINLFTIALVGGAFWTGWRFLSPMVRRHTQIAALINIPLFLFFGFPGEIRGLSLLYISFLIVLAASITNWMPEGTGSNSRVVSENET
jgi:hypothetical protein